MKICANIIAGTWNSKKVNSFYEDKCANIIAGTWNSKKVYHLYLKSISFVVETLHNFYQNAFYHSNIQNAQILFNTLYLKKNKSNQNMQQLCIHTEKSFRNLIKSNWNQIVFIMHDLFHDYHDLFWSERTSVWFQIIGKIANPIWFQLDLIRFRKDLSVCRICLSCWTISFYSNYLNLILISNNIYK